MGAVPPSLEVQLCARLDQSQDVTAGDDACEVSVRNHWQLIHVIVAHDLERIGDGHPGAHGSEGL